MDVLIDLDQIHTRVETIERVLRESHPDAWVTVSMRRQVRQGWSTREVVPVWCANAFGARLGVLRADAPDPVAALDGLAAVIARRVESDDAVARTLGIGEAA